MDRSRYKRNCVIPNCNDKNSSRHRVPTKRIFVKQIWLSRIKNESLYTYSDEELNSKVRICGAHFLDVCKRVSTPTSPTTLFANALPTINMPGFTEEPTTTNSFYNENIEQQDVTLVENITFAAPMQVLNIDAVPTSSKQDYCTLATYVSQTDLQIVKEGNTAKELKMSQEIVKFDVNNGIPIENSSDIKKEFGDECYSDNKICISETSVNITNTELNDTVSINVKIEDEICSADTQAEYYNGMLFCNHCGEVYQDYCTKCRVLVHILNKRPHNIYNRVRELPKYMLEARESLGHLGIFSLKVIPENVRFGPFTGLHCTGLSLKIKGGEFVVSDDQSKDLNWMQYINPARNIYEQNLFPFQYEDKLYYSSTRRIQEGEELLVYFGEEYVDNLFENVEIDFVPIVKEVLENVFACTLCCLGFSSKECLAEHKAVCRGEINKMFSVEELVQCPFCKIYLDAKEYLEHHMDYCCETNARFPSPEVYMLEVERRTSGWNRALYKCTQCKFKTMYNACLKRHTNEHCNSKISGDNEGRYVEKYSACHHFKANVKNMNERSPHSHNGEKQCKCSKCKFQARDECHLKSVTKAKRLKQNDYKCVKCENETNFKSSLLMHIKSNLTQIINTQSVNKRQIPNQS